MGYTHNRGFSAINSGYAVGAKSSERRVIGASGQIYVPQRKQAGDIVLTTAITTAVTATSVLTAAAKLTLTASTTLTDVPLGYIQVKGACVDGAATKKITLLVSDGTNTTTTTATATKATVTLKTTAAPTDYATAPVVKVQMKSAQAVTGTAKVSIASIKVPKKHKLYLGAIT